MSTFPHWIYDGSPIPDPLGYGQDAVDFLRALKHPNSTAPKNAFQLHDWQERIVRRIYGPRHPDGRRIVETVFWMIPRGNRKTSLAAALALLHTIGPERVPAGQVIFAASDREQAGLGFKEAANIVRMDKRLVSATRIYDAHNSAKKIVYPAQGVGLQAISSDGAAQHGKTPSFVLVDEIHVWKGRELWEALKSGMVKTSGALMVIATTAGRGSENIGFEQYEYARRIARGEIVNPAYLPIIFEADNDNDWQDEAVWHRTNPGLAYGFPNLDALRTAAKEAEHRPADRHAFLQFNLNIWQAHSRDPLFDMAVYDAGHDPNFDLAELEPLPCWIGVDLSREGGDLTAIVAAWRHPDGRVSVHPWFYLPSQGLAEKGRVEQVPYLRWQAEGALNVIEGPIIEPDEIVSEIINICGTYNVQEVVFDPALAGPIMGKLMDHGIDVLQQRQRPSDMHGPVSDFMRIVNGKRLRHGGHPILRHHIDSTVISRATNGSEIVRIHKGSRHTDHIDGTVASAIAVARAAANDNRRSIHDMDPEEEAEFWTKVHDLAA